MRAAGPAVKPRAGPAVGSDMTVEHRTGRSTISWIGRRALRRLLDGRVDPADRPARRAGVDPFPAVIATPRIWIALG